MKFKTLILIFAAILLGPLAAAAQSTATIAENEAVNSSSETTTRKPAPMKGDWTKTWSVIVSFNTTLSSNLEHDPVPDPAAGFTPSVTAGYQIKSKRHRVRFIYGLAASRYTQSTDLNRVGQYFGTSYRISAGRWNFETEGEAILKGTNEDRETNDQYIAKQKLGYRFDGRTRASIYYAYRIKRYIPAEADRNAVNPMYGFKFQREIGQRAQWEIGYRYDETRAQNARQSYVRSTYDTSVKYKLTKRDTLEAGFSYKPRLYSRTVRVGDLRVPRHDHKYLWEADLHHNISPRFGFDLGYAYEKQNSNDPEKLYHDHQFRFTLFFHWGNGDIITP
jgi:hypothetical protein